VRLRTLALGLLALGLGAASPAARAEPPAGDWLLPGDCAGVYWDLTAAFAGGDRLYARVLVTREGPGELGAASLGHWIDADGTVTRFQNGRGADGFEHSHDGARLRIGSTRMDLSGAAPRFEVDNDKRGVKLRVELESPGKGLATPIPVFAGALETTLLHLGSAATASFWRRGMDAPRALRGWATLARTRHAQCERDLLALRVEVHQLRADGVSLLIHQRPVSGEPQSWLAWRDGQGALVALRPQEVTLEPWVSVTGGGRVPRGLRLKGPGLRGSVAVGRAQLSIDPLDALPRVVRMLYWFGAHPRRIWADATSELSCDLDLAGVSAGAAAAPPPRGAAIASFTYLRSPDDPTPSARSAPSASPDSGG
jgi:hypothetical protein